MLRKRAWVTAISATNKVIRNMNAKPRPCILKDLKDIVITIRSMDIEILSADPNPSGHQTRKLVKNNGNFYNWDYITRYSCHYYQEYGHVPENYIRTHFKSDYRRWLSQTTCFSYLKTGHISINCPTRSKEPNNEFNKGKGKVDVEKIRDEMNKTWKRKEDCSTSSVEGITSPNGSDDHTSSN